MNERLIRASRGALTLWLDATKWWTGAVADSAGALLQTTDGLIQQPIEVLARAFMGRRIEAVLAGKPVRAALRRGRFYRGGYDGARLEFSDVEWDGLNAPSVLVTASRASVTPPPSLALSMTGVEIRAGVPLPDLVDWADRHVERWRLTVPEPGLVQAVSVRRHARVAIVPTLAGGELELTVREVGWRRVRLRVPRFLRLMRRAALPALPEGVVIQQAHERGNVVEFVLSVAPITKPLDLRSALPFDVP